MAELRPNRAREKLANGEIVTCLAGVDTPHFVDFVGQIGIDAVWLKPSTARPISRRSGTSPAPQTCGASSPS